MRSLTSVIALWLLSVLTGVCQPCQSYKLHSLRQRHHLKKFISECERTGFLSARKGILLLETYQDTLGQTNWWVQVDTDTVNSYHKHAPVGWFTIASQLVLVYHYPRWQSSKPTLNELKCLDQLVGDRVRKVYPRRPQPLVDRFGRPILDKEEKAVWGVVREDIIGGGPGNSTHFVFKRIGRVSKLKGV